MPRTTLSRSAIMKAAHARVAASRAFLARLAAEGHAEPARTLARFNYRAAFADALSLAWAVAKQEAELAAMTGASEAHARYLAECSTDGRLAA